MFRLLEVNQPGEQSFEFDVDIGRIEVKVKPPKGFSESEVTVYLAQSHPLRWRSQARPDRGGQPDAKGSITFEDVPEGPWRVVAWADRRGGGVTFITSEDFELAGTKKLSLKFDERVGSLNVRCEDMHFSDDRAMRIELIGADGTPAVMGDPFEYTFQHSAVVLQSVAKGKYTLRITGDHIMPFTKEGVTIETGRTTDLAIALQPTCDISVRLKQATPGELRLRDVTIQYFDAAGKEIDPGWPETADTYRMFESGFVLTQVPPECTRVMFKARGYKALNLEVKPKPRQQTEVQATLEIE
jgi:hypothetical protein